MTLLNDLCVIEPLERGGDPCDIMRPLWHHNYYLGIPYSEHSSFDELKRCVQALEPLKIIPTVNNFSVHKREEMQRLFKKWLQEMENDSSDKKTTMKQTTLRI